MKRIMLKISGGIEWIPSLWGRKYGRQSTGATDEKTEPPDAGFEEDRLKLADIGSEEDTLEPPDAGFEENTLETSDGGYGNDMLKALNTDSEEDTLELVDTDSEEDTLEPVDTGSEEDTLEPPDTGNGDAVPKVLDAGREEGKRNLQAVVMNHKGRVRGNNEDNFCFNGVYMKREEMDKGAFLGANCGDAIQLYAVCDGMGGADCGEEASYLAAKELADGKGLLSPGADRDKLTVLLRTISERIYEEAREKGKKSGTTLALMLMDHGRAVFANVGDSRIYCFHEGKLSQISMDHSKVQRMISMGILTPEQAKTAPDRHVITQYLGMPPEIKVSPYFAAERELGEGDVCLLCSDGLTDLVTETRIEEIIRESGSLAEATQTLLDEALKMGGRDNITILLVRR